MHKEERLARFERPLRRSPQASISQAIPRVTVGSGALGAETARVPRAACARGIGARDVAKREVAAGIPRRPPRRRRGRASSSARSERARVSPPRPSRRSGDPRSQQRRRDGVPTSHRAGFDPVRNHPRGHFLLTGLLLPCCASRACAVVCVSSRGHRLLRAAHDPKPTISAPRQMGIVGHAKTATSCMRSSRPPQQAAVVRGFALHPGAIMTELGRTCPADNATRAPGRTGGRKWRAGAAPRAERRRPHPARRTRRPLPLNCHSPGRSPRMGATATHLGARH